MSKSAIATLKKAEQIMATAGVINIDLVAFLNDGKARIAEGKKLWRNADKLALLIVDSAANAFQGENSQTLSNGDNFFSSMNQAVEAYISSNIDCWSQVELEDCTSFFKVDHLARLAEMVAANIAFEKRQAAHDEALAMNAEFDAAKVSRCRDAVFFDSLDAFGRRVIVEAAHGEALMIDHDLNLKNPREIKYGDRHCFTDCGYLCSAKAREDIEKHYQAMQEDAGDGWIVRVWHNMGWHAELFHDATGCSIKDRFVRGGSEIVYLSDVKISDQLSRHGLSKNNDLLKRYALDDGDGCSVLAETPSKAIEGMIEILNNQASYIVATIQNLRGY